MSQPAEGKPPAICAAEASGSSELGRLLRRLWPVFLGNSLEWYEFATYGYCAVYLKANFFQGSDVATWMGYGASFLMRPLGGIAFGALADRFGRKPVTVLSLSGMVLATGLQGALPAVRGDCSWGVTALVVLRLAQGIFLGGEEGTVTALLAEEAPMRYKSLGTTLYLVTAYVAFMLTAGMLAALTAVLTPAEMLAWGWRLPFLLCFPLGLVALCGRGRMAESEEFQKEAGSADRAGRLQVVREYGGNVVVGCLAAAGFSALFYTATAWSIAYLTAHGLQHGFSLAVAQLACFAVGSLACGRLGDEIGAGGLMLIGAVATAVLGVPVFALLEAYPTSWGLAFLGLGIGYGIPVSFCSAGSLLFCAELFPTSSRSLGLSLTHNLAMSFVGGAASYMAQQSLTFSPLGPGLYISFFGLVSVLAVGAALWARSKGRKVAHLRPEPYCKLFAARGEQAQKPEVERGAASLEV